MNTVHGLYAVHGTSTCLSRSYVCLSSINVSRDSWIVGPTISSWLRESHPLPAAFAGIILGFVHETLPFVERPPLSSIPRAGSKSSAGLSPVSRAKRFVVGLRSTYFRRRASARQAAIGRSISGESATLGRSSRRKMTAYYTGSVPECDIADARELTVASPTGHMSGTRYPPNWLSAGWWPDGGSLRPEPVEPSLSSVASSTIRRLFGEREARRNTSGSRNAASDRSRSPPYVSSAARCSRS
jgi:hypothetical protein